MIGKSKVTSKVARLGDLHDDIHESNKYDFFFLSTIYVTLEVTM